MDATYDEMAATRRWVAGHVTRDKATLPFSFVLNSQHSHDLLSGDGWQVEQSSRPLDNQRQEHTLVYTNAPRSLIIRCTAVEYTDYPAVEWILHFTNSGQARTPILEKIEPLDLTFRNGPTTDPARLHYALGDGNSEHSFAPAVEPLAPGTTHTFAPNGGRSSDGYLPFFNLQTSAGGTIMAIGWSGQWQAMFACDEAGGLRAQAGMATTHLALEPGETIRTPRILLLFWQGDDPLRGNNLLRQLLLTHYLPRRGRELVLPPICGSVNEVAADGSYEEPHLRVMPVLAARGVEVFWSDMDPQQWYPVGFPKGTGTWEVDRAKYPHGLRPIGEAAHAAGLGYLLWFEPERVHPGTRIDREHSEWVMPAAGEWSQLFRLHDPVARAWLTDHIDEHITAAQLDWLRWDFNIQPLGFWQRNDSPDRQGMTEIRYIEGLYAMWDELRARHPGLMIDNCASGGRRLDLETLSRSLPLWHSDLHCFGHKPTAEQLQNGALARWIPLHGCAVFGYEPSYAFRSGMTAGNIICATDAHGHHNSAHPDTAEAVQRTGAVYRKARPYLLGDFYPLFPHESRDDAWYGYQFHRPDLGAGMVMLFRRENSPDATMPIHLEGLVADATYAVTNEGSGAMSQAPGCDLAAYPATIDTAPGSAILWYCNVTGAGESRNQIAN
ncbi:MAG: alpha-galactosidase [Caldilineaceae bacterium]